MDNTAENKYAEKDEINYSKDQFIRANFGFLRQH